MRVAVVVNRHEVSNLPQELQRRVENAYARVDHIAYRNNYMPADVRRWCVQLDLEGDELQDIVQPPLKDKQHGSLMGFIDYQRATLARERQIRALHNYNRNDREQQIQRLIEARASTGKLQLLRSEHKRLDDQEVDGIETKRTFNRFQYQPVYLDNLGDWSQDIAWFPGSSRTMLPGESGWTNYEFYIQEYTRNIHNTGRLAFFKVEFPDHSTVHLTPAYLEEKIRKHEKALDREADARYKAMEVYGATWFDVGFFQEQRNSRDIIPLPKQIKFYAKYMSFNKDGEMPVNAKGEVNCL
jgi:hypothetical protein